MAPTLEELRARYGERYKWLVLLTVMIGTMASTIVIDHRQCRHS